MARKPRFALSGYPQHIVQRGNKRQPCFFEEADYFRYLDSLAEVAHNVRMPGPRLCPDDQSCAPAGHTDHRGGIPSDNAVRRETLCPLRQRPLSTDGHTLSENGVSS